MHVLDIKDSLNEQQCSFLIDKTLTDKEIKELETELNAAFKKPDLNKDFDIEEDAAMKWFADKNINIVRFKYTELLLDHNAFD